ncbi:hypothetical protein [Pectobacterium versatile]|nr:hypothetical protein [Pectobacterium versatile]
MKKMLILNGSNSSPEEPINWLPASQPGSHAMKFVWPVPMNIHC